VSLENASTWVVGVSRHMRLLPKFAERNQTATPLLLEELLESRPVIVHLDNNEWPIVEPSPLQPAHAPATGEDVQQVDRQSQSDQWAAFKRIIMI
jgi:hypothetical protein